MYKGEAVYLYSFDIADEIKNSRVQKVLSKKTTEFELHAKKLFPKDLRFRKPLEVSPTIKNLKYKNKPISLTIRIFGIGVVDVLVRIPFEVKRLAELDELHDVTLENNRNLDQVARTYCAKVRNNIKEHVINPLPDLPEPEAYTIFCIKESSEKLQSEIFLKDNARDIVGLLSQIEPSELSEKYLNNLCSSAQIFERTDLVLIDWDAALVVDQSEEVEDVLFAIEIANIQLEQLKILDTKVDQHIEKAYGDLTRKHSLFGPSLNKTLQALREFSVDITKLNDEIHNVGKFFGDWYLAKVFSSAVERFHVPKWQKSIDDKLNQLDKLYSMFRAEIAERKMLWLELIIVLLFIFDIIAIVWME